MISMQKIIPGGWALLAMTADNGDDHDYNDVDDNNGKWW